MSDNAGMAVPAVLEASPDASGDRAAAARRARFLQLALECQARVLPDNIDYLFLPAGEHLPDPATAGERLAAELEIVDRAGLLWRDAGDEATRELFLRFLLYRALGPAHVRLQLEPGPYRQSVIGMSARLMRQAGVALLAGLPLEYQLHLYDLSPLGFPVQLIGPPLPIASTYVFSQYAHRDESVPARPRAGDVAVDVGGCWGETALWLAARVGATGRVVSFEPCPSNRALLERNLSLNGHLAGQIEVRGEALGPRSGDEVWMTDGLGAGVSVQPGAVPGDQEHGVAVPTASLDELVADGALPRVDFLKVDVEGADVGVLEGAAEAIRTFRPRLALACYHKPDDLVQIPELVASLGVPYRWYLQCSTMTDKDTVLFGVPAA